ncbi:MAG TPA: hypothetical protein VHM01_05905, partial [Alphaproteobacteria bacterium]|nr:hypothetical protein [Alphaproteobacteria bacterium]
MTRRSRPAAADRQPRAVEASATGSLAILLDRDAMLVVGSCPAAPPASADATFGTSVTGAWRAMSWSRPGDNTHHFIGILWAENIVRTHTMGTTLRSGGDEIFALPEFVRIEVDIAPLLPQLKEAGTDLAAVFDFLRRTLLSPPAGEASGRTRRFLFGFLNAISSHDGFIEILGRPEGAGLMLQGWSVHLHSGPADIIVVGPGFDFE